MSMTIRNKFEFLEALAGGPYAWPGGYPLYFVTADGAALSFKAAEENKSLILESLGASLGSLASTADWRVVALAVNYEDSALYCDHTGERIPSAYADELAEG